MPSATTTTSGNDSVCRRYFERVDGLLLRERTALQRTYEQHRDCYRLMLNLEALKDAEIGRFRGKTNIGSEVYAEVEVSDCSRVFVELGCGIFMEKNIPEALEFLQIKGKHLQQ